MTLRPLPPSLPPLTLSGLQDLIHGTPRACQAEPGLFFGPDTETPAGRSARVAAARRICEDCPARLACLAYALRTRPEFGVWAGHDAEAGELSFLEAAARHPFRNPPRPADEAAAA